MEMTDEIRQELRKHTRAVKTAFDPIQYCEPDGIMRIKEYFVAKVERLQEQAIIDELVRFVNEQKYAYPVSELLLIDQDWVLDILGKQIPKPVWDGLTCPSCHSPFLYANMLSPYCQRCGQALKWTIKKEERNESRTT